MDQVNIMDRVASFKHPTGSSLACFPTCRTAKLGDVDTRNVSIGVVLATLDRWGIKHCDNIASLRRSEARNLRRALFGSRGTQIVPRDNGQMAFELFDGMLYLDYERPPAGRAQASHVRLRVVERRAVQ